MALTQMQLIQSLGDAMAWFERELNWGVPPTELRHLCGRIGELYTALITNGQMATEVNQQGYDVVSGDGERISVKTTAMMGAGGHIAFNSNSMEFVDRVIVLRVNTDEMQIETLLNAPVAEAVGLMSPDQGGKRSLPLSRLARTERPRSELKTVSEVSFETFTVRELENGSIEVEKAGTLQVPTKPALRELARKLNISLLNGSGNPLNTRQLGSQIIKSLSDA
ncbi:hypothetical protein [Marinobacter sp. NFXS9]|uniref:DUF6998 domain-containing protein n=1 Tax=Marinobacter sp. NFXS9 TaxID=2818433 RepID=UPI0032DEDD79